MPRPPRFDITRVRLRHYRSIPHCDVKLGDLTFLVGPNGSGKSNFLDSLRLVSQALDENLDNALRERGGATEVRRRSTGHPTHFSISLEFRGADFKGNYAFSIGAVKGGDWRVTSERCEVEGVEFGTQPTSFEVRDGQVTSSLGVTLPPAAPDRLYLVAVSGFGEFRPVFDGLSALNVYSLSPDLMKRPQTPDTGELLRRDGSNIASVLERLRREHPRDKSTIEDYLRLVVPGMETADRLEVGSWETVQFRQRVRGADKPWLFPATSVSDGTLRALGVLVALFAPSDGGYTPIGIEEPETALHPAATGVLLDALQTASRTRQVLVTSHSPDLLDTSAIGIGSLLAVRADSGDTRIGPVDEPTARALMESLYTPGELLRVDQLQPDTGAETLDLGL
jgi:predicted ATPase